MHLEKRVRNGRLIPDDCPLTGILLLLTHQCGVRIREC